MSTRQLYHAALIVFALFCVNLSAQAPVFLEQNGLVVVEVESVPPGAGWVKDTRIGGYTGSGYYRYTVGTPTTLQPAGSGAMAYKFKITNAGTYHFRWLNYHNWPADQTLCNDSWLKMDNGSWEKCFQTSGSNGSWNWKTQLEAGHGDYPPPSFNLSAGYHTVYISGRSFDHHIDRFHLSLGTANTDKTKPESPREGGVVDPPVGTTIEMKAIEFPYIGTNFYKDGSWLAINPDQHTTAEVTKAFPGEAGTYDITFHGVGESDGQSQYWLYVNGSEVGNYKPPISPNDFDEGDAYNKTWTDVSVAKGADIKVKAAIGSADGKEWARARWLKVVFDGEGGGGSTGDPVKITSPSFGTTLGMGASVTLTGTGENLSWTYDANSDGLGPMTIGTGNSVQFTIPTGVRAPMEILIKVTGDGGSDEMTYQMSTTGIMDGLILPENTAGTMVVYNGAGHEVKRTRAGQHGWQRNLPSGVYHCLVNGIIHSIIVTK